MPTEEPIDNYGSYGDNLLGNYDIDNYLYQDPLEVDIYDFYGSPAEPVIDTGSAGGLEDPAMYFDEITTTTVPPDMYDYLFSHSRHRFKAPVRKKFDAQALKAAYAEILKKAKASEEVSRVTRSVFSDVEDIARQFLQRITGPSKPQVFGLLDRRAPFLFRQNSFVKISLSQFSIVSTGTTGKKNHTIIKSITSFSCDVYWITRYSI